MNAWQALARGEANPLIEALGADEELLRWLPAARIRELMRAQEYVGDAVESRAQPWRRRCWPYLCRTGLREDMPDIIVLADRVESRLELLLEAQLQRNLKDGVLRLLVSPDSKARGVGRRRSASRSLAPDADCLAGGASCSSNATRPSSCRRSGRKLLARDFHERFGHKVIALHAALPDQFPGPMIATAARHGRPVNGATFAGAAATYIRSGRRARPRAYHSPAGRARQPRATTSRASAERMALGERWVLLKSIKQLLYELRNAQHRGRRNRGQPRS